MIDVKFCDGYPRDTNIKYAVTVARYKGKWILCRHRARSTWEIPGGHIEANETPDQAASRELWEETGATKAVITPICFYSVQDYGRLYFAEIEELGHIPESSEIRETGFFDELPENLTYPHIQPKLFDKVNQWLLQQ